MSGHIEGSRLHDYVEGLATEAVTREVEAHLAGCEECRRRVDGLVSLLAEMAELPGEALPERDLWPEVRARMDPGEQAGGVGAASDRSARPTRRFSFSMGQLMAASIALAFISGATVWMVLNGGGGQTVAPMAAEMSVPTAVPAVQAATTEYDQAIASLESVLDRGKGMLDPETLETIEESLRIVDQAIDEARRALAADPNNDLLNRLLIQNQQSKLRVLKQASAAVQI